MIFNALLKKLFNDERGSAMTEFVIGLPVFVIIFSGMGALYQVSQAALITMATANAQVWSQAQDESLIGSAAAMSPVTGTLSNLSGGGIEANLANGAGAGGIYFDSWGKLLVTNIIPGAPGTDPVNGITKIHKEFRSGSPAKILLNDRVDYQKPGGNGVLGFVSTVVSGAGAGLALGAGIRYGQIEGVASTDVSTPLGNYTVGGDTISLPRNTVATYRLIPLGMIRLEHSKHDATHKSILNFEGLFSADLGGPPDYGAQGTTTGATQPDPEPGTEEPEPTPPSHDAACALLGIC